MRKKLPRDLQRRHLHRLHAQVDQKDAERSGKDGHAVALGADLPDQVLGNDGAGKGGAG